MTDLEITKLCARAMGYEFVEQYGDPRGASITYLNKSGVKCYYWRPLHDDAQMAALVKEFRLSVFFDHENGHWCVSLDLTGEDICNADLNRAACMCVAKMEKGKP